MSIVFLRLEWMSAHWIHLCSGLVPLGFELVMWERTALKLFICFLFYIKHTVFPSSNSVEEIPTSKTTYCPKRSPQLSRSGPQGLTHCALASLPPSTNISNSGDIRTSFLFGQPVAKNQIKKCGLPLSGYGMQHETHSERLGAPRAGDRQGLRNLFSHPLGWERPCSLFRCFPLTRPAVPSALSVSGPNT